MARVFVPVTVLCLHGQAAQSQGLLLTAVGSLLQDVVVQLQVVHVARLCRPAPQAPHGYYRHRMVVMCNCAFGYLVNLHHLAPNTTWLLQAPRGYYRHHMLLALNVFQNRTPIASFTQCNIRQCLIF